MYTKLISTYSVKVKNCNAVFKPTVSLYRQAVDWYIDVCLNEWESIKPIASSKARMNYVQSTSTITASHPSPAYDFTNTFYKVPVYLRRAAINEAIGKVSSYMSRLENWNADPKGEPPGKPVAGYVYPVLYNGNMFVQTGTYEAKIKVWVRNTWDWLTVKLRKSDVDYIQRHCINAERCAPVLQKRGKQWYLDFPFEERVELSKAPVSEQTIIAVDLGINSACTCSAMRSDGTVIGRKFLCLPVENDSLTHRLNEVKQAQQRGNRKMPRLWASVDGMNERISVLTAQFIVDTALMYDADVIVFEHLDTSGKKRGPKKQRLHFWKAQHVQELVTHKAHKLSVRVSHVCAWNTSKLAYDGSGRISRGSEAGFKTWSVCRFTSSSAKMQWEMYKVAKCITLCYNIK